MGFKNPHEISKIRSLAENRGFFFKSLTLVSKSPKIFSTGIFLCFFRNRQNFYKKLRYNIVVDVSSWSQGQEEERRGGEGGDANSEVAGFFALFLRQRERSSTSGFPPHAKESRATQRSRARRKPCPVPTRLSSASVSEREKQRQKKERERRGGARTPAARRHWRNREENKRESRQWGRFRANAGRPSPLRKQRAKRRREQTKGEEVRECRPPIATGDSEQQRQWGGRSANAGRPSPLEKLRERAKVELETTKAAVKELGFRARRGRRRLLCFLWRVDDRRAAVKSFPARFLRS